MPIRLSHASGPHRPGRRCRMLTALGAAAVLAVTVGDVSFDSGSADIKPAMRPVLDEVGRNLDGAMRLTIVGHTDSTGGDAVNEPLSRQRAESVRSYLTARGVDASRVSVVGRGSREPVASNDTDSGRAANRRVEIFLADTAS